RVDLKHPRRAPNAQALGQARDHPHDQLWCYTLAVEDGAESLQKVAVTDDAQQLTPAPPIGMAVGADIAPARPALVPAMWVRTEVGSRIDLAVAPPCGHDPRGRSCGSGRARVRNRHTGVTVWLVGKARKR